jgi:hypothetical protein
MVKQTLLGLPSVHSSCDHSLHFTRRKAVALAVIVKILMSRNNEQVLALKNRNGGRYKIPRTQNREATSQPITRAL